MALSLLGMVGELVVAIPAPRVFQIRRAVDTATRRLESNLYALDLDDETLPGWDLGDLLGLGLCNNAWVIIEAPHVRAAKFGLRMGRCIAVRDVAEARALPEGIFGARRGALAAGFAAKPITELDGYPSGVVLALEKLFTAAELEAGARVTKRGSGREAAT